MTSKLQHRDFSKRRDNGYSSRRRPPSKRYWILGVLLAAALWIAKSIIPSAGAETIPTPDPLANAAGTLPASAPLNAAQAAFPAAQSAFTEAEGWRLPADLHSPFRNYPAPDTFAYDGKTVAAEYSSDSLLNARTDVYLKRYRPETAVMLVCDLRSGRMLSVGERRGDTVSAIPRMAFGGGFPAASLVKIVTAVAALETLGKDVKDSIPLLGRPHTLYRSQLRVGGGRRLPMVSFEDAFAKSVNPAFGLLGLSVGADALRQCAGRMGFNRGDPGACLVPSRMTVPDTGFELAEASCGFTQRTTISPWHALAIARGAGDDGFLRPCAFARSLTELRQLRGDREIDPGGDLPLAFVSPHNLPKLQSLMEGTVGFGTGRKGFRSVLGARRMEKLSLGGKTGSLDGSDPKGRYEWFVGYARLKEDPSQGLALSIMLVHREYQSVHPSQLAALLVRDWMIAKEKAAKIRTTARPGSADSSRG